MTYYEIEHCDGYYLTPMDDCPNGIPEFYIKEYIETHFTEEERAKFYEVGKEWYHIDFEKEDDAEFIVHEHELLSVFLNCIFFMWKREQKKQLVFPDPLNVFTE